MATSSSIKAGGAWLEISADAKPLLAALRAGDKALTAFGHEVAKVGAVITGLGTAIGGSLLGAAAVFDKMGSDMLAASQRTGIAVDALSALKFAADQSNLDFNTLLLTIGRMQKSIAGVADEAEGTTGKLDNIGLSAASLAKLSPDEQFQRIAQAISAIQDPAQRTAAVLSIFGRSGAELLPLFNEGSKGVKALTEQAKALGIVISTTDAIAADRFGDAVSAITAQIKAFTFSIGAAIGTALIPYAESTARVGREIIDLVNENRGATVALGLFVVSAVTAGTAITGLGLAISGVGLGLGKIATVLGFVLTPLGALTVGLTAGTAAWLAYTGEARNTADFLGSQFTATADTVKEAVKGIADAFKTGDLKLASQIAVTEMKIVWAEFSTFIANLFDEILRTIATKFAEAFAIAQKGAVKFDEMRKNIANQIGNQKVIDEIQRKIDQRQNELAGQPEIIPSGGPGAPSIRPARTDKAQIQKEIDQLKLDRQQAMDQFAEGLAAPARELKDKLDAINAERDRIIGEIDKAVVNKAEARANALREQLAALEAKLAADTATAAQNAAVDKALDDFFRGIGDSAAQAAKTHRATGDFDADAITKNIAAATDVPSRGLFNIGGLLGLQGGGQNDYARKTAEAAEKTARNTDEIARAARLNNGLVFTA